MAIQNINPYTQYNYGIEDTKKKQTTPISKVDTNNPLGIAGYTGVKSGQTTPISKVDTNNPLGIAGYTGVKSGGFKTKTTSSPNVTSPSPSNGLPTANQTLDYQQQLNRYSTQKDQLKRAYDLALSQYGQQEGEAGGTAERLGSQAYQKKMQTSRLSQNVLSGQGLQGSGYEKVAGQQTEQTYRQQYGDIMNDYQNALSAIKRSRESEQLQYEQNVQNVDLGIQEQNQNYQLLSQQALDAFKAKETTTPTSTTTAGSDFANIKSINIKNTPKDRNSAIKQAYDYYIASGKTVNEATVLAGQYADYLGLK